MKPTKTKLSGKHTIYSYYSKSVLNYLIEEIFNQKVYSFSSEKKSPLIFDIGANIGLASIFFIQTHPTAIIKSFEPQKENIELFNKNIKNKNIELYPYAISNKYEERKLYICSKKDKSLPISSLLKSKQTTNYEIVNTVPFHKVVKEHETIDLCKIDIEGEESNIVEDLINHKLLRRIKEYIIEYHFSAKQPYSIEELIKLFNSYGFLHTIINEVSYENNPFFNTTLIRFKLNENRN